MQRSSQPHPCITVLSVCAVYKLASTHSTCCNKTNHQEALVATGGGAIRSGLCWAPPTQHVGNRIAQAILDLVFIQLDFRELCHMLAQIEGGPQVCGIPVTRYMRLLPPHVSRSRNRAPGVCHIHTIVAAAVQQVVAPQHAPENVSEMPMLGQHIRPSSDCSSATNITNGRRSPGAAGNSGQLLH
jgi:hypothetical protein